MSEQLKRYTRTTQWDALDQFANTWEAEYRIGGHLLYVMVERDRGRSFYRARATGPDGRTMLREFTIEGAGAPPAKAPPSELDSAADGLLRDMVGLYVEKGLLV